MRILQRCRPYGAWFICDGCIYRDVAPTGLTFVLFAFYRDVAPTGLTFVLFAFYRDVAPTGLTFVGYAYSTEMSPLRGLVYLRWLHLQRCRPYGANVCVIRILQRCRPYGANVCVIRILQRCRPYGANVCGLCVFYRDVAPTGLGLFAMVASTEMSPLRGLVSGMPWYLQRC